MHRSALSSGTKPGSHSVHDVDPGDATSPGVQLAAHACAPSDDTLPASHSSHRLRSTS